MDNDFNGFNDDQEPADPFAPSFEFHSTQHLQPPPPEEELVVHVMSTLMQYLIDGTPVDEILSDGDEDIDRVTDSKESDIGLFSTASSLIQVLNYNQSQPKIHQIITNKDTRRMIMPRKKDQCGIPGLIIL